MVISLVSVMVMTSVMVDSAVAVWTPPNTCSSLQKRYLKRKVLGYSYIGDKMHEEWKMGAGGYAVASQMDKRYVRLNGRVETLLPGLTDH